MSYARQMEMQAPSRSPLPRKHWSSAAQTTLTALLRGQGGDFEVLLLLFPSFK